MHVVSGEARSQTPSLSTVTPSVTPAVTPAITPSVTPLSTTPTQSRSITTSKLNGYLIACITAESLF